MWPDLHYTAILKGAQSRLNGTPQEELETFSPTLWNVKLEEMPMSNFQILLRCLFPSGIPDSMESEGVSFAMASCQRCSKQTKIGLVHS